MRTGAESGTLYLKVPCPDPTDVSRLWSEHRNVSPLTARFVERLEADEKAR